MKSFLTDKQRTQYKDLHRSTRNKRHADRIKAILHLDSGMSFEDVAKVLLIDDQTIRRSWKKFESEGIDALLSDNFTGSKPKLSSEQEAELKEHLIQNTYLASAGIQKYIFKTYKTTFTISGLTDLLHRLGFTHKKPKIVPGKADSVKQKEFLIQYRKLKKSLGDKDKIYFMDGVHPQHNSKAAYGWILKGHDKELKSNTGRQRININGAINIQDQEVIIHEDETINADTIIKHLRKIERKNSEANKISIICDNARYYRSKKVTEYLENSKIELVFLPPYSPNLNLIERLWKFFQKKVVYNQYYETFSEFRNACMKFFRYIRKYKKEISSLLTENFQIIEVENSQS
jgi:transposase